MKIGTILLTTRCNMCCSHCGRDSGPLGIDITTENFIKYLDYLKKDGVGEICLTGGEPTLHPNIIDFIKLVMDANISIQIITNGKLKEVAFALCEIATKNLGKITLWLSLDEYHEPISSEITSFFKKNPGYPFFICNEPITYLAGRSTTGQEWCKFKCTSCERLEPTVTCLGIVHQCCHPDSKPIFDILNNKYL